MSGDDPPEEARGRSLAASARVATLATLRTDGTPHLVPCVFVVSGDVLYTAVDRKPKRVRELQRLRNIERDPRVALLMQHWDEDWTRLWWARVDGVARVTTVADELATARRLLLDKYPQYRDATELDPVIAVDVQRWRVWSASPAS